MSSIGFTVRTELGIGPDDTPCSLRLSIQYDKATEPSVLGELWFPFSMTKEEGETLQEYFDEFSLKMFNLLATLGHDAKGVH